MDDGRRCLTSHIDTSPELCSRASGDTFQFFTHHRRGHRSARWNWKSRGRGNGPTGYGVGDVAEHQQQHDHEGRKISLKELNQKQARPRIVSGSGHARVAPRTRAKPIRGSFAAVRV